MPRATIRPASRTRIWSACLMVATRWATMIMVAPVTWVAKADRSRASVAADLPPAPVVKDESDGLLLTWIDDKGDFHVETGVGDVPMMGRDTVRVFDPAKAGVEVTAGKGGVTVKKAHEGKPFAGVLRAGDLVTAIGDAKVPSPEAFRRQLRAALAEGSRSITLTVTRSGKSFDVPVRVRR